MKYRGIKYTSGLLTAGAAGIILSVVVTAKDDAAFSEPDQNRDQLQVSKDESDPEVNVQSEEPEAAVREQESQQQGRQDEQQAGQARDIYAMSIADIRDSQILDPAGNIVGGVQEVIVKNDGSDAGLIVRTSPAEGHQGQLVYIPADALMAQEGELVLDPNKLAEEAANAEQFDPRNYNPVPESDQRLNELVGREEVTQR